MKTKIIASGSKGNCTFLYTGKDKYIIDIGISYLSLKRSLERNSLSLEDIKGIFITHAHSDHIKGLTSIIKYTKLPIFIPEEMYEELEDKLPKERCIFLEDNTKVNQIDIELIHTSHDAASSVGYIITYMDKRLVYVTDTGYINRKYLTKMQDADIYILESNYDETMLMDGPYPYILKQRVVSDTGHLSNKTTSRYLKKIATDRTKYIVLAHISEKNNTEEIAYQETSQYFLDTNVKILTARQNEESDLLEV